jgi:hypothetical protein
MDQTPIELSASQRDPIISKLHNVASVQRVRDAKTDRQLGQMLRFE